METFYFLNLRILHEMQTMNLKSHRIFKYNCEIPDGAISWTIEPISEWWNKHGALDGIFVFYHLEVQGGSINYSKIPF